MELLHQEIVKLLAKGATTAGEIRNRLNGQPLGLDVSFLENVPLDALRRLEGQRVVECFWRISQSGRQLRLVPT